MNNRFMNISIFIYSCFTKKKEKRSLYKFSVDFHIPLFLLLQLLPVVNPIDAFFLS